MSSIEGANPVPSRWDAPIYYGNIITVPLSLAMVVYGYLSEDGITLFFGVWIFISSINHLYTERLPARLRRFV